MKILPVYVYSGGEPCNGVSEMPYPTQLCNYIEQGLLDSEAYMRSGDAWFLANQNNLWTVQSVNSEWAKANNLSSGNLYFVDTDNLKFIFKLPRLLITRSRVREVMKVLWDLKYQEQGGQPGYVSQSPNEGETWYPLTAIADDKLTSAYGNPVVSILEMVANILDATIDALLPNVLNLVPWWGYVAAAGYTGYRTRQDLPRKPSFKNVKLETYAYGLGTAFLLYRSYRSFEAKQDRVSGIAGHRRTRVSRRRAMPQINLN